MDWTSYDEKWLIFIINFLLEFAVLMKRWCFIKRLLF